MKKSIKKLNIAKVEIIKPTHLSKLKGGGVIASTATVDAEVD